MKVIVHVQNTLFVEWFGLCGRTGNAEWSRWMFISMQKYAARSYVRIIFIMRDSQISVWITNWCEKKNWTSCVRIDQLVFVNKICCGFL